MRLDAALWADDLESVTRLAQAAERAGIAGVWLNEIAHDPFPGATLAVEHTRRTTVGTGIALAFVRSPTSLAYLAWDLARYSGGRFILGLGSQVRAHVERRFGMRWDPPRARLRDVIGAIRAVWRCWRDGTPLRYEGRFHSLSLITPFFTPARYDGEIPIHLAAVNPGMYRLAGEVADGVHVHPFHSLDYLTALALPALHAGLRRSGRAPGAVAVTASVVVAVLGGSVDRDEVARARQTIAFYASTPTYRPVLAHHGWEAAGERLSRLAATGRWQEMPALVTDEMLETFGVVGARETVAATLRARYAGLADRLIPYRGFDPDDAVWSLLADALADAS